MPQKKFDKEYIGQVVYNLDPTYSGRCKIKVYGLFDELPDEDCPWFVPQNLSGFSSSGGAGCISVPKIGAVVRVKFQNGDIYSGEYSNVQTLDPNLKNEIKDDYVDTHVLCYDADKDLMICYQPMTGIKLWLNGSMVKIDANGSIQLKHQNNTGVVEVNSDSINVTEANGTVNISGGTTVNITSGIVNINGSSVALGNNAVSKAVKGEKLIGVLQQIVTELNTKYPQSVSTLAGRDFKEILSSDVTLS